jgi:hypothetical protein
MAVAGDQTAVSGAAAAYWHGLVDRAPAEVELTVPHRRKPRPQPGLRIRRRDLHHADLVGKRDIRLAAVPLTVLETAVVLTDGSAFLDRARSATSVSPLRTGRSAATWAGRGPQPPDACWSPRRTGPTRLRNVSSCGCCARRGSGAGCSATSRRSDTPDRRCGDIRPVFGSHVPQARSRLRGQPGVGNRSNRHPGRAVVTAGQAGRRCCGMRSCRERAVSVVRWKWPCRERAQR